MAPISLFLNAFASFQLPESLRELSPLIPALKSNWLIMHVTVMLLSYTTLIAGSLLAITFLFFFKKNSFTSIKIIEALSPNPLASSIFISSDVFIWVSLLNLFEIERTNLLNKLDRLSFRVISIGFPLLTIGILSGSVWANEAWGSYWSWDPKETWSLITWIIYAIYLHLRLTYNWNNVKSAILATVGFFVIWICFLGVNFVAKGLHSYGWLN